MLYRVQNSLGNWYLVLEDEVHSMATPFDQMIFFGATMPEIIHKVENSSRNYNTVNTTTQYITNHHCVIVKDYWCEIGNSCADMVRYSVEGRKAQNCVWSSDFVRVDRFNGYEWESV